MNVINNPISEATRPIYWNLPSVLNPIIMYALFAVALIIFANAIIQRLILWNSGATAKRKFKFSYARIKNAINTIALQKRTRKDSSAGIFHTIIYLAFIILFITTTTVFFHHDFNLDVYKGYTYLVLTVLSDSFGLLCLIGIAMAFHRRYHSNANKLHNTPSDSYMLKLIVLLIVQGFILEALRLHGSVDPWEKYSFVGYGLSRFFWALTPKATSIIHFGVWWFHTITVFTFIALIPYTKFFHIISSSLNLLFTDFDKPKGALAYTGDIEKIMEEAMNSGAENFSLGIGTLNDLDWKRRLDLEACTSCGRCQDVCPAYASGKPLSPKFLILDSRDHMLSSNLKRESGIKILDQIAKISILKDIDKYLLDRFLLKNSPSLYKDTYLRSSNQLVQNSVKEKIGTIDSNIAGDVIDESVFWSCTTCRACQEVCPVNIEHVDYIIENRRNLLLIQGKMPSEAQGSIRSIESQGTIMGNQSERSDWTKGLTIKFLQAGDSVDILYWVGCISAFDTRKQQIAKSMVKILNASGLSWGMLGNLEKCTGDPARRIGDENTFQLMAKTNISTFKTIKFNTIVTHCPHCFNTIKNEYPEVGNISENDVKILHHSTFIAELLKNNTISIDSSLKESVTYHDPCYLGRHNDIYDEPREVLVQLGAKKINEMSSCRELSKCCGAGGGHYMFDMKVGERINVQRVKQALDTKSDLIATSCPFCMQMLEDGVKLNNSEEILKVKDISEIISEQLR